MLEACGGTPEEYTTDGISILDELKGGEKQTHDDLFWEMEQQTAIRHGKYKLVINGQLVEGEEKRAELFLSDIIKDPGEKNNLCEQYPELAAQLKEKALAWREGIEKTWKEKFAKNYKLT